MFGLFYKEGSRENVASLKQDADFLRRERTSYLIEYAKTLNKVCCHDLLMLLVIEVSWYIIDWYSSKKKVANKVYAKKSGVQRTPRLRPPPVKDFINNLAIWFFDEIYVGMILF